MRGHKYVNGQIDGWSTWVYGGKNTSKWWQTGAAGTADEAAFGRPLNPYLYPEVSIDIPTAYATSSSGATWNFNPGTPSDRDREALQLTVFRSPGDRQSCQRNFPTPDATMSSYDDVGTSYHINMKWWDQPDLPGTPGSGGSLYTARYNEGVRRIRLASEFDPTGKFVWIHDQTADVVANISTTGRAMGEFGEFNKSVHAYLDGRAQYNLMKPGYLYDDTGNATRHAVGKVHLHFLASRSAAAAAVLIRQRKVEGGRGERIGVRGRRSGRMAALFHGRSG
jgi:hypothetical protein